MQKLVSTYSFPPLHILHIQHLACAHDVSLYSSDNIISVVSTDSADHLLEVDLVQALFTSNIWIVLLGVCKIRIPLEQQGPIIDIWIIANSKS